MNIGQKLRAKRDIKRLSQQEVAEKLHISQRTYSNIESNKSEPSLTQLSKLSEILDFNLLELLQEQGIVFNQPNSEFKNNSGNIVVNNNTLDKTRIKDLEEINQLLRDKIKKLETEK